MYLIKTSSLPILVLMAGSEEGMGPHAGGDGGCGGDGGEGGEGGGGGGCKGHASTGAATGQAASDVAQDTPTAAVEPMHWAGNSHEGQRKLGS